MSALLQIVPDTSAGKQLQALLAVIADPRPEAISALVERSFDEASWRSIPAGAHQRFFRSLNENYGSVRVEKVVRSAPDTLVVLLRGSKSSTLVRLGLRVTPAGKVSDIAASPLRVWETNTLPEPPAGKLSDRQLTAFLDRYLKRLTELDAFSGAALIARDGRPIFRKSYGLASRAWQVPNRVDTKFNLGSMNKMFTSVCIAQLVAAGKCAYTDTIGKHLPDYPNADAARKVTLHHLLTHTSGVGDYFNDRYEQASRDRFRRIADFLPLFAADPLQFEPGTSSAYSNGGFMVLGAIVEKASGRDYFDYVRDNVYRPAGMVNTDAYEMDRDTPNLAIGYTRESAEQPWRNNLYLHVIKGGPAGGGFSTVEDLLRFDQALRSGKLLPPALVETITSPKSKLGRADYGYGFFIEKLGSQRIVGHGGGFPGISSNLDMYLDAGVTVSVMCNVDEVAQVVNQKVRELLTR